MNKKLLKVILALTLVSRLLFFGDRYNAETLPDGNIKGVCVEPDKSKREVKKVVFGNGLESVVRIVCSPEIKSLDELGRVVYKRKASVIESIFHNKDGRKPKKILSDKLEASFTYDKKSFVKIENPDEDVHCTQVKLEKNKWKTAQTYEILPTGLFCTVSETFAFYKDPKISRLRRVDNSHIDLTCSSNGYIGINLKNV